MSLGISETYNNNNNNKNDKQLDLAYADTEARPSKIEAIDDV